MENNKTLENLMAAFAGESQANRKYLAYAQKAEKDGKLNAAKLFKAASTPKSLALVYQNKAWFKSCWIPLPFSYINPSSYIE